MPLIEAGCLKNNYPCSTSGLKALVSVSIQEFPLSKSLLRVKKYFMRAVQFGWQTLCRENHCAVSSGSSYSAETCHFFEFFSLQRLVCSYAVFSLRHRQCKVVMERKHGSKRRGLQHLLRWSLRRLHQRDLCWQRNKCNHFRSGPGKHLPYCGDNLYFFGHGKSVLKRGVLPGSPECSCSDCDLFKHLYRRCLHKPFPVQYKHAAVWKNNHQATPTNLHEF